MRVRLRPTVLADLAAAGLPTPPSRIQAITAVCGDEVLGVGGIGHRADGIVIAFAQITAAGRRYPAAIHRAGRAAMAMIVASGVPEVVAEPQAGNPAAARWLNRLGFRPIDRDGQTVFVWQRRKAADVE